MRITTKHIDSKPNISFQISAVSGCQLNRKADLGFSFRYGTCASFNKPSQDETLLLCFDMDNKSSCRHYSGDFGSNRDRILT